MQSILELFRGKSCPQILGCEFAENDCWYVTFSSEADLSVITCKYDTVTSFFYLRMTSAEILSKRKNIADVMATTVYTCTRSTYWNWSDIHILLVV